MPFNSRKPDWNIVTSDSDDPLTAQLSSDLQIVAEQLSDDAQFLAERYPAADIAEKFARSVELQVAASQATASHWRIWQKLVAAAVLIAIGSAGTAIALHWSNSSGPTHASLIAASDSGSSKTETGGTLNGSAAGETESSFGVRTVGLNTTPTSRNNLSEVEMLQIQTTAFEQVIHKLQDELVRRDKQQTEMQQTLEALRQEVHDLRQQLNESQPADKAAK
jgi:hypothetical protein